MGVAVARDTNAPLLPFPPPSPAMESNTVAPLLDWRPWVAGALCGCSMTLVGHPFDTIKVRMQTATINTSTPIASPRPTTVATATATTTTTTTTIRPKATAFQCLKKTVQQEGFLALYRGLPPAIMTSCFASSVRMGLQDRFNKWLVEYLRSEGTTKTATSSSNSNGKNKRHDELSSSSLPLHTRILAEAGGGAACGIFLPILFTPMELIKVQRQIAATNSATTERPSGWRIFRDVVRERGIRGLYTGHSFTVARSTLGNATFFGSFEVWKHLLSPTSSSSSSSSDRSTHTRTQHNTSNGSNTQYDWRTSVMAAILAGWSTQLMIFPIDAAKSRVQASAGATATASPSTATGPIAAAAASLRRPTPPSAPAGLVKAITALWHEGAMYRGISSMLVRAVPVHAAYLPVYGFLLAALYG